MLLISARHDVYQGGRTGDPLSHPRHFTHLGRILDTTRETPDSAPPTLSVSGTGIQILHEDAFSPTPCLPGGGIPLDFRRDLHITLLLPLPLFSVLWEASPLSALWWGRRGSSAALPGTGPSLQHIPLSYCLHETWGLLRHLFRERVASGGGDVKALHRRS